jgi:chaperonin GroEL (HSP60 family)
MDVIDTLAGTCSKQLSGNNPCIGEVKELKIADMRKKDNIEPRVIKEQVLRSAIETAAMLLNR